MLEEQNGKEGAEREGGEGTGEKGSVFLEASVRDPRDRGAREGGARGPREGAKLLERADMSEVSSKFCEEVCLGFLKLSWVSRKFLSIEERMIHNT
jgi:hypothetical protein